jgi:dTMP kinase
MTVNRLEVQPAIAEALGRGPVVLDRWYASSLAYGAAEGLDAAWLATISATLLEPDLTIWLDVDPVVAAARRPARDLNESDLDKQRRARAAYQQLFMAGRERWVRIDASAPLREVCGAATKAILAHVVEHGAR